jgi:hypothetical protein
MTDPHDPDAELDAALRRSRVLEDAPEPVIQRVLDLWQRPASPAVAPGPLRRLVAALSFDSAGLTPGAVGLRGGSSTRQLLFSADGRDIDLRIEAGAGATWQLSGQILGPDEAGTVALRCGSHQAQAAWNELSEFRFEGLPAGMCQLTLRTADWELVLPELQIPPSD